MKLDVAFKPAEVYPLVAKRCIRELRQMKTNADLNDADPTRFRILRTLVTSRPEKSAHGISAYSSQGGGEGSSSISSGLIPISSRNASSSAIGSPPPSWGPSASAVVSPHEATPVRHRGRS
jgi:hypothetical protein